MESLFFGDIFRIKGITYNNRLNTGLIWLQDLQEAMA